MISATGCDHGIHISEKEGKLWVTNPKMNFIKIQHQAKSEYGFLGNRKKIGYDVYGPINLEGTEFLKCNQVAKTSGNSTCKSTHLLHCDIQKICCPTGHI